MKILTRTDAFNRNKTFEKEIAFLKNLDHPNILKIFEYFIDKENIFIITELCVRGDLAKYIRKEKFIKEYEARHIAF